MENLKKENKKTKDGLAENELMEGSPEIQSILNREFTESLEIQERNKKFDLNFNELVYYKKVKALRDQVREFSASFYTQALCLAMGGHDYALKVADEDILREFFENESRNNEMLLELWNMNFNLGDLYEILDAIVMEGREYIEKQEVEVFMKDWYKN